MIERVGAGYKVGEGPDEEDESSQRPSEDGEPQPLHQFAAVVGGGDVVEHAAFRQIMVRVFRTFAEMADDVVGAQVDEETRKEEEGSCDELRRVKPLCIRIMQSEPAVIDAVGLTSLLPSQ